MATTESRSVAEVDQGGSVYDGFISYSHAADDLLAPRLQAGLQKFAKPWWQRRALRIFRDESSLAANPHLWSSITEALDQSGWLILLLSPDAASSLWVNKEVEYWLDHKDPNRIIPVLTDGEFGWSDGDVTGDAVPPALAGVFEDEPRWVDLCFARSEEQLDLNNASFRAAVADVASAIRQIPKDELESEEVRQHRRTRRTAWAAALALLFLGVGATAAAIYAVGQSSEAQAQRDEAERQTALAEEQTLLAERQTRLAEDQTVEAEAQTALAQEERDRAELLALEALSARLITESEGARVTDPAVADLLAVEARRQIDIEVTRANLARNTLSASAFDVTRFPHSATSAGEGPDGTWTVVTYGFGSDDVGVASDGTGSYTVVEEADLVAQRPGARRLVLPGAQFAVVEVSDDGSRLVVVYRNIAANETEAIVVDATTFEPLGSPIPGPLSVAVLNPDGSLVAAARTVANAPVGTVNLMTIGGEVVTTLPADGDGAISDAGLVFSRDGHRLVSMQVTSSEGVVKAWDVATGALLLRRSFGDVLFSNGPAMSADGRYIAVPGGGQNFLGTRQSTLQVTVLDVETGDVVAEIALDTFDPSGLSVGFAQSEPLLAIGDSSGTSIVSTETFDVVRRIDHATGAVHRLGFGDQDRILVAYGAGKEATRVDLTVERSSGIALPVSGITALSPAGDTIAVITERGSLSFWSATSGEQVGTASLSVPDAGDFGPTSDRVALAGGMPVFSADGTVLYVRDRDGHFSVVEVSTGEIIAEIDLPVGRTYDALATSAAGNYVATGHSDGTVMLWDAASFGTSDEPAAVWQLFDAVGTCAPNDSPALDGIRRLSIAETTSGLRVQVVDQCGIATPWEIAGDEPVNLATWANSFVLDFGPDGSNLVSQQGTRLRLVTDDGTVVGNFTGHREEVLDTNTSLDLGTMASVSRDMVGLWYTRSGEPLASGITGAQAHISGDGSHAVTSGAAGFDWFGAPVVVWDLDPDSWEEQACESAGRNLSFFEWNLFFPDEGYRVTCPQWPSGF